jgi:citrate lyase subunit beta/citryl-CoA lyase
MRLRSLLFVPGDRPELVEKAYASGADAIILDLEDSVALAAKDRARADAARVLQGPRPIPAFVRVNPLPTGLTEVDLDAVMQGRPDGVILPKAEGARSIAALDALLETHERRSGTKVGETKIIPIATETPAALFRLGEYDNARLCGLTWGAEDLPAIVGSLAVREDDGRYTEPFQVVRALALFAAAAAGVAAIDTIYPNFKDTAGLSAYALRGARDGFSGMLALHPAQIAPINAAFTPTPEQIAHANAVVAAFAAQPEAGVVVLDGHMLDAPHLMQARRVLSRSG